MITVPGPVAVPPAGVRPGIWYVPDDGLSSRSARARGSGPYEASLPARLAGLELALPAVQKGIDLARHHRQRHRRHLRATAMLDARQRQQAVGQVDGRIGGAGDGAHDVAHRSRVILA